MRPIDVHTQVFEARAIIRGLAALLADIDGPEIPASGWDLSCMLREVQGKLDLALEGIERPACR